MVSLLLLIVQAQARDTATYASPALKAVIERAAAANAAPPPNLRGYTARYESEVAMAKRLPDRIEGTSTVEQTAGEFTWEVGHGFGQHELGYRVVTTGVPLPASAVLDNGWVVPTLTGPKIDVFGANSGAPSDVGQDSSGTHAVWSPLGPDRERFYRFEGGDTLTMDFPAGPPQRVVRIIVVPRDDLADPTKVFRGDLYLDPATGAIRRLRGQSLTLGGPPPQGRAKRLNRLVVNAAVADVVTTEVPGAGWVPTYQRIELEVLIPLTTESWSVLRLMTQLRDVSPNVARPGEAGAPTTGFTPGRSAVSKDSLHAYDAWQQPPDKSVNSVYLSDLFDVGPPSFRFTGPPIYFWRGPTTLNALQFNRVDGLYTGVSGTLRLRDAMPGVQILGTAGYAWWSGLFRGGITASRVQGHWISDLQATRITDLATKFPDPLDYNRGLRALFQADNYDYVDRASVGAGVGRYFSASGPGRITARFDYVKDYVTPAELNYGPLGQSYTINPYVTPYEYPRIQVAATWNPEISSHFTHPGLGLHASYEAGWGDLYQYQLIRAGFVARANWKSLTLTIVGDGGITISDNPPTQQMILIGGSGTMPGYNYDQFGGNVGALTRTMVAVPLPFLQTPLTVGKATVPPIAPNFSVRVYSGYTETTNAGATTALQNVGTVDGAPFSVPSGHIRNTMELRLSLLGTLLGFGIARPLESGGRWTFQFAFAQSF